MMDAAHSTAAVVADEDNNSNDAATPMLSMSQGGSPLFASGGAGGGGGGGGFQQQQQQQLLRPPQPYSRRGSTSANVSRLTLSSATANTAVATQWSQTTLTLPPTLPEEVERVLAGYFTYVSNTFLSKVRCY